MMNTVCNNPKTLVPESENLYVSDLQIAKRYSVSRPTVWRWASTDPTFPEPKKLSKGCTRWTLASIEAWEASK